MRRRKAAAHLLGLAVVAAVTAASTVTPRTLRPNVLLVTVDTLRADSLGCYGSPHGSTPHIDRLAAEGVLFLNAACPLPLTRPSHFTMMTSRYPRDHGVVNNALVLPPMSTLPDVFRRNGYQTAGFVATKLLGPGSGADQGFGTFVSPTQGQTARAEAVASLAVDWMAAQPRAQPFFLWLHLFDPHMPYEPPPAHRPQVPDPLAEALPEVSWPRLLDLAGRTDGHLPAHALTRARELYAGEVSYTDEVLGRVLAAADRRDPPMVVAFTADHGECFDHGSFFEHSDCLYDGAIRVPLLLRYPPRIAPGRRHRHQVELLDLAPTLLDLAGVPIPPEFKGLSLMAAERGGAAFAFIQGPSYSADARRNRSRRLAQLRSVAGERVRPLANQVQVGVRTDSWKYVAADREELYALGSDPAERHNLASVEAEVLRTLRDRVARWLTAHPQAAGRHDASPELLETLGALGYVQ